MSVHSLRFASYDIRLLLDMIIFPSKLPINIVWSSWYSSFLKIWLLVPTLLKCDVIIPPLNSAGIKHTARVNEPILSVVAEDPDLEENGTLVYMIAASNLYKFSASKSSGSVVPSPFNISQDGKFS